MSADTSLAIGNVLKNALDTREVIKKVERDTPEEAFVWTTTSEHKACYVFHVPKSILQELGKNSARDLVPVRGNEITGQDGVTRVALLFGVLGSEEKKKRGPLVGTKEDSPGCTPQ